MRDRLDWFVRDPKTGRVVIGQPPNPPLMVWGVTFVVRLAFHPGGTPGTVVGLIGTGALAVWAVLEIVQGVNPLRRTAGAAVLAWQVLGLLHR